ncbi:MAG TPA: hypothetical protein VI701_06795 [Anaerolineales bacterium]|nr:hypothetical protein [Anaerolineales bacterium]
MTLAQERIEAGRQLLAGRFRRINGDPGINSWPRLRRRVSVEKPAGGFGWMKGRHKEER